MRDVVVLCSGGVDSSVLVARAANAGRLAGLVFANYGQPAALMEWRAFQAIHKGIGRDAMGHEVPMTTTYCRAMRDPAGHSGARVVPVRNLIMVAHAANFAVRIEAAEVWIGAIADDAAEYHDCRSEWMDLVSGALAGDGVRLVAPLVNMSKREVVDEARALGVLDTAWSCYTPIAGKPCMSCNSCRSRIRAMM